MHTRNRLFSHAACHSSRATRCCLTAGQIPTMQHTTADADTYEGCGQGPCRRKHICMDMWLECCNKQTHVVEAPQPTILPPVLKAGCRLETHLQLLQGVPKLGIVRRVTTLTAPGPTDVLCHSTDCSSPTLKHAPDNTCAAYTVTNPDSM